MGLMSGVFVTKQMTLVVPAGGLTLSINDDGKLAGSLKLQVHYDVCPTRLNISSRHLSDAEERKRVRDLAWNAHDEEAKALSLEAECESSMQAIMAAAIAIDSLYAALRDKVKIPDDVIRSWRENKTARFKQVTEVFRRSFSLKPRGCVVLRQTLREIFKVRDMAIHPTGNVTDPVLPPELQVGVEWRFALFHTENAKTIVKRTRSLIRELVFQGKPSTPEVQRYVAGLRGLIEPMTTPAP